MHARYFLLLNVLGQSEVIRSILDIYGSYATKLNLFLSGNWQAP